MPDVPDAALMAACTELDAALKEADELDESIHAVNEETVEANIDRLDNLAGIVSRLPAGTRAGLEAKARAVAAYLRRSAAAGDLSYQIALSLAQDVLEAR